MFAYGAGTVAKTPYEMPYTGQKVYSIEELCYYLYHNIYSINEEFFQPSLAEWLRDEVNHGELADKISHMLQDNPKLKDLVVTILCGCDYYKEEEIHKIIAVMDGISHLPLYKKKKIKADNYVRAGRYGKGLLEYRKLLQGSFAVNFSTEEYGDILHNQGIAHFYTSSFEEAEADFKEAYVRNQKKASLQHYLWLLLMQEKEQEFEAEAVSFGMKNEEINRTKTKYQEAVAKFRVPKKSAKDLERYKKQLIQAFSC